MTTTSVRELSLQVVGILSVLAGMLLFELLLFAPALPAITWLIAFFAFGIAGKFIQLVRKHPHLFDGQIQRVITVELDVSQINQRTVNHGVTA